MASLKPLIAWNVDWWNWVVLWDILHWIDNRGDTCSLKNMPIWWFGTCVTEQKLQIRKPPTQCTMEKKRKKNFQRMMQWWSQILMLPPVELRLCWKTWEEIRMWHWRMNVGWMFRKYKQQFQSGLSVRVVRTIRNVFQRLFWTHRYRGSDERMESFRPCWKHEFIDGMTQNLGGRNVFPSG